MAERNEPSPAQVLNWSYRESRYLEAFPDVAAAVEAGDFSSGLAHFLFTGNSEMLTGTRPRPTMFEPPCVASRTLQDKTCGLFFGVRLQDFDECLYQALFPDVLDAVSSGIVSCAFEHWLEYGFAELASGRRRVGFVQPASHTSPSLLPVELGSAEQHMTFPVDSTGPRGANNVSVPIFRRLCFERLMDRPFGVNLFGPFAMESGLGTIARSRLSALRAAGILIDLWPYDVAQGWRVMPGVGRKPQYRVNLIMANADTMQFLMSIFPSGTFDDAYNIGLWQWELASMRPDAILTLGNIDEVWTSSTFERDAIAAISPVPVHVVPPSVRPLQVAFVERWTHRGIADGTFVFIVMLDMASRSQRKNAAAAIQAFAKLNAPEAVMLVKLHGREPSPENLKALRQLAAKHERVLVLEGLMSEYDLARLRDRADCLVSPHRSEGFGLNIAEFMALGKPVVATDYSGNTDFFDATVGYPVEYDLVELSASVPPYPAGYVWAEPRLDSLVACMRDVLDDADKRRLLGEAAAARMAGYTDVHSGQFMVTRLSELGLNVPKPPFMSVANGLRRALTRTRMGGEVFPGPTFSVPVIVENTDDSEAMLAALSAQTNGGWELLLRAGEAAGQGVSGWLDRQRGSSPRVRVLPPNRPDTIEAATCAFILFVADANALDAMVLADAATLLADEPACDVIIRSPGLVAIRKSLLLVMGLRDLRPVEALDAAFARSLAVHTKLIRRLDPPPPRKTTFKI